MKQYYFIFLVFILCFSSIKTDTYCLSGAALICEVFPNPPMYSFLCSCLAHENLWNIPYGYKLYKKCDGNQYPYCVQNNLFSPELYCECRT